MEEIQSGYFRKQIGIWIHSVYGGISTRNADPDFEQWQLPSRKRDLAFNLIGYYSPHHYILHVFTLRYLILKAFLS